MEKPNCVICGKPFLKRRKDSVCCSNKCKAIRGTRRYRKRLQEKKELKRASGIVGV